MDALRIHLFGGFLLERGGVALPPIASRAGRSLFAYLVMHPGRPIHRDVLAGVFWPDIPEARSRRRLSHTLWQVQDVVNSPAVSYLDVTVNTVAFDSTKPYWLDIKAFEDHLAHSGATEGDALEAYSRRANALRTCVELYRGEFLAGTFDDWVLVEQDHYRQRYLSALGHLIDATKSAGAYDEALTYARRLTHHDPLSEGAHREVMRLCFLLGRTSDAVEQYQRVVSVLDDELGTEPAPATTKLYEKILKERRAGIRRHPEDDHTPALAHDEVPFVGREGERRLLVDAMESVLGGSSGFALIEGEPGVGKTRLAVEASDDARWRGFDVNVGACQEHAFRPFGPLIDILESLSALRLEQLAELVAPVWLNEAAGLSSRLADRIPTFERVGPLRPTEQLARTREALVNTLVALGKVSPHVLIVDDAHWADRDTLAVLAQLATRLNDTRILVLLTYRSDEARGDRETWEVVRQLDRNAGLGRAVLSPLSVFELEEMVRRILDVPHLPPSIAAKLHRRTGGNALFAMETLLSIRDHGALNDESRVLTLLNEELPDGLEGARTRSVIASRVSLLGLDALKTYQLASVIGDPLEMGLLEDSVDLPRNRVLAAVDELLHRGLLTDTGDDSYRLSHDQIRQTVYESIDHRDRQAMHLLVARGLERLQPHRVEAIGHHFLEAGETDRAARALLDAGDGAVEMNAFGTACALYEAASIAAADAGWADGEQYQLLARLENVLGVLGQTGVQASVLSEMSQLSVEGREADLARRTAWHLASEGRLRQAEEMAKRSVVVETDEKGSSDDLAASLVALGTIKRWAGRPLDAVGDLERAVEVSDGEREWRARALTELASTLVEVQRPKDAMGPLEAALEKYRARDDLRGQVEIGGITARAFARQGEGRLAESQYELAIDLSRKIGYRHGEGVNLTNLANLRQLSGDVARSIEGYDAAAVVFADLGNSRGEATVLANSASARHHLLGDDERALVDATRAMDLFEEIGDRPRVGQCQEILAGIEARSGNFDESTRLLNESIANASGTGAVGLEGQHLRSLVLLEIEKGELSAAADSLERMKQLAVENGLTDLEVDALSIEALLDVEMGRESSALAKVRRAADLTAPEAMHQHTVLFRHATVARAVGADGEAGRAALAAREQLRLMLDGLDEDQRAAALGTVEEHRRIEALASHYTPTITQVLLPATDAPSGRSLDDHEQRRVSWTLDHPADRNIDSPIERRRSRLMRLIAEAEAAGAAPAVENLAAGLEVSESTIRRDLAALREQGHVLSTRGHIRQVS